MTKTAAAEQLRAKQLIDEISKNFHTYLMNGVRFESFSREIDPNLNIDEIDKLLRIHFVLKEELINFVQKLPERVRGIKTTLEKKSIKTREVRGNIEWLKTIQQRCKVNYKDKTLFICNKSEKNFNINENLVLKKLLRIVHTILSFALE